jgi:hypothetical protein
MSAEPVDLGVIPARAVADALGVDYRTIYEARLRGGDPLWGKAFHIGKSRKLFLLKSDVEELIAEAAANA